MADYRVSSFLPTIKCSMCHRDIEISQMGDHVCSSEPTPPLNSYENFDRMPYNQSPSNGLGNWKTGRAMPPRVDTSAANRPFFRQDQLTPVSMSPMTPNNERSQSPFGRPRGPSRSATAPVNRPPSPETMSSNLDCAFPPFPSSKPLPSRARPQPEAGYGGFAIKPVELDSMYAPVSPMTATSGGVLRRMNTIAPGPFDISNQTKADTAMNGRNHRRQKSLKDVTMSSRTAEIGGHIIRPSTASGHSHTSTNSSSGGVPKLPRIDGYGGYGPPSAHEDNLRQLLRPEDRAHTFPLRSETQDAPLRRPSEPDTRMRRPSNESSGRRPSVADGGSPPRMRRPSNSGSSSGPDLSRPLPPRGASFLRPRTDARLGDAPPVPSNVNLAAEFGIGNPYHTPSESQSSSASGYSQESKASSRSSPPHSTEPVRARRNPSDISKLDNLMSEVQASMADLQPRPGTSSSPPKNRPQYATRMAPVKGLDPSLLSPESPMDPAMQNGRLPVPSRNPARSQAPLSPPKALPSRRPTTSKGNCKGCGDAIKGKSVSSADGRLTGRYHKQCFVCVTCSEPFQTSTFYVIDDSPYCERHYHKLNGSVCDTCDKGIEGQYLESERKQKFHPGCLTCADCKRTLRNDYFEMNGQVYCERDAFRRAQQDRFLGPGRGTNKMERRTTRLMMM